MKQYMWWRRLGQQCVLQKRLCREEKKKDGVLSCAAMCVLLVARVWRRDASVRKGGYRVYVWVPVCSVSIKWKGLSCICIFCLFLCDVSCVRASWWKEGGLPCTYSNKRLCSVWPDSHVWRRGRPVPVCACVMPVLCEVTCVETGILSIVCIWLDGMSIMYLWHLVYGRKKKRRTANNTWHYLVPDGRRRRGALLTNNNNITHYGYAGASCREHVYIYAL